MLRGCSVVLGRGRLVPKVDSILLPTHLGGRRLLAGVSRGTGGPGRKGRELGGIISSNRFLCSGNFPPQSGNNVNGQKLGRKDAEEQDKERRREGANRGKDEPRNLTTVLQMGTVVTVLGLISTCLYYIVTELLPTKMSPNTIFNRAFEIIQMDPNIANHFGTPLKAYGRDHGGHREGRRNYIEHETYTSPDDSSNRCRVRFNLQGPYGHAFVFAEVSSNLPSDEWVYLMVQDTSTGHVISVVDNRSRLSAEAGASSEEEKEAIGLMLRR